MTSVGHLISQSIKLAQPLNVTLAHFATTIEIAHALVSLKNCSNNPRRSSAGPMLPSLMTGIAR
jgi:hypothetical protein